MVASIKSGTVFSPKWLVAGVALATDGLLLSYDVRLGIAPQGDGLAIVTSGQSALGPFDGSGMLLMPQGAPARLTIRQLDGGLWANDGFGFDAGAGEQITIGNAGGANGTTDDSPPRRF